MFQFTEDMVYPGIFRLIGMVDMNRGTGVGEQGTDCGSRAVRIMQIRIVIMCSAPGDRVWYDPALLTLQCFSIFDSENVVRIV